MSEYDKCKSCGAYDWIKSHKCPPRWECQDDDMDASEWELCHGRTPEDAAENFAQKRCDNGDSESYPSDGDVWIVRVKVGDQIKIYDVTASWDVSFDAREQ